MPEKITYNIKNVKYALMTVSESGVVTFAAPVALPGASAIALPPVGEAVKVYADGVVYVKFNVNQGYDGDLSIYNIPDSFARDVLGMTIDSNGVLIEVASAVQKDFALIGEFDTDTTKSKRWVLFSCSAGRSDFNGTTKEETINPEPFSIPITAAPLEGTEYVKASILGDSTDSTWSAWLASVYTPALTAQFKVTVTVNDGTDPIADVLVVCGSKIGMTDSLGKAYFMHPAGTYDILVSVAEFVADTDTVTVTTADVGKTVTMVGV